MKKASISALAMFAMLAASVLLTSACGLNLPRYRTFDKGITNGEVEFRFMPDHWGFDGEFTHAFCRDEEGVVYSADSSERILHKPKGLLQDMDYRPLVRSDVTLPDFSGETSIPILRTFNGKGKSYTLPDREKAELLSLLDLLNGNDISTVDETVTGSAYVANIYFTFSDFEGLTYGQTGSFISIAKLNGKLYVSYDNNHRMTALDESSSLFRFISDKV